MNASRNIALKLSQIVTLIAQLFYLKEVLVTKCSDRLWGLKFRVSIDNRIFDYENIIDEINLCDWESTAIADVICYEIEEINYRYKHESIGDITCMFNAHSPQLRCSVNPSGPCEGCGFYESN